MTELLFQKDGYLREFEARVLEIIPAANAAILDRTAFYPGGGGQPCDIGTLDNAVVTKVQKTQGQILHSIEGGLPVAGSTVHGVIDWDRRYKLMRTHSAMHVLCGVVFRDYGALVTGGDMEPLRGRMDFEFERLQRELVALIEAAVNLEIRARRPILVNILPLDEAFRIPDLIRTKINLLPDGIKQVRTVEIVGLDLQADGGTHVNNIAEIGPIRITDYKSKGALNKRIYVELQDA